MKRMIVSLAGIFFFLAVFSETNEEQELGYTTNNTAIAEINTNAFSRTDGEAVKMANWSYNTAGEEADYETRLTLENWMSNLSDSRWQVEDEKEITTESWMLNTNDTNWVNAESEETIELEDWMLTPADWIAK